MATDDRRKKNTLDDDDNDPPIIISGGGGVNKETAAENHIHIDYHEHGSNSRRKVRAKVNTQPHITGVTVVVEGLDATSPRVETLKFPFPFENYRVTVTFATGAAIKKPARGVSGGQAKKAYSKAPAASKKSK